MSNGDTSSHCFRLSSQRKSRKIPEDLATAEDIKEYKKTTTHTLHSGITCLDLHPADDSRALTGGADGVAHVLSLEEGRPLATLTGHSQPLTSVLFHPSQDVIFTTSLDRTARVWVPGDKGKLIQYFPQLGRLQYSACGQVP